MPRTIIYPQRPAPQAPPAAGAGGAPAAAPPVAGATGENYAEKLVKYIPGEVVAVFIPLAALAGDRDSLLITALIVGLLATPFYLWQSSAALPKAKKPRFYFYILSIVAFCAWALTTSRLGDMLGLDETTAAFILAVTVFAVPAVDTAFVTIGMRRPQKGRVP